MKILAIGDIVGKGGVSAICSNLSMLKKQYNARFTIVNGENADMVGILPEQAEALLMAGVDVITLGNHTAATDSGDAQSPDAANHIARPFLPILDIITYSAKKLKNFSTL